jgi:ferredoxin
MSLVIFRLAQIRLVANSGDRLVDLLDDHAGHGLPLACRGANCAICRVRVHGGEDALLQPDASELRCLAEAGALAGERLACQLEVAANPKPGTVVLLERVNQARPHP